MRTAALAIFFLLASPRLASAGCCFSTTATTTARLALWERAAIGFATTYQREWGYFNTQGRAVPFGPSTSDQQGRLDLFALARITDRATLTLALPAILNARTSSTQQAVGAGVGDLTLGGRFDLLTFDHSGRLGLALIAGLAVPIGRDVASAQQPLGVDATGRGAFALSAGVSAEWANAPWFVRADLVAWVPVPAAASPTVDLALQGGVRATDHVFFVLSTRGGLQLPTAAQAFGYDVGFGGGVIFKITPQWAISALASSVLFINGAGMNKSSPFALTAGLRYAVW